MKRHHITRFFNILLCIIAYCCIASAKILAVQPKNDSPMFLKRQYMLNLMNSVRRGLHKNLPMLYIDDTLNILSQQHSEDMIKRKFFDHISPDNKGVGDRAKQIGFKNVVGQNIAISGTIQQAHDALMKSEGHYNNTINPQWTRCGIGFKTNRSGRLYTTIVFSTRDIFKEPLSKAEISEIQKEIVNYILTVNSFIKEEDQIMSQHIKNWFEQNQASPITIWEYLKKINYKKPSISYTKTELKISWSKNLIKKIRQKNMLKLSYSNYKKVGVYLKSIDSGIHIIIVYSNK